MTNILSSFNKNNHLSCFTHILALRVKMSYRVLRSILGLHCNYNIKLCHLVHF